MFEFSKQALEITVQEVLNKRKYTKSETDRCVILFHGENAPKYSELFIQKAQIPLVFANSILSLREILVENTHEILVIITSLIQNDLSDDIYARIYKKLHKIDVKNVVKVLFKATSLSAEIQTNRSLLKYLAQRETQKKYPPVMGGELTMRHLLTALLDDLFSWHLDRTNPFPQLVKVLFNPSHREKLKKLDPSIQNILLYWLHFQDPKWSAAFLSAIRLPLSTSVPAWWLTVATIQHAQKSDDKKIRSAADRLCGKLLICEEEIVINIPFNCLYWPPKKTSTLAEKLSFSLKNKRFSNEIVSSVATAHGKMLAKHDLLHMQSNISPQGYKLHRASAVTAGLRLLNGEQKAILDITFHLTRMEEHLEDATAFQKLKMALWLASQVSKTKKSYNDVEIPRHYIESWSYEDVVREVLTVSSVNSSKEEQFYSHVRREIQRLADERNKRFAAFLKMELAENQFSFRSGMPIHKTIQQVLAPLAKEKRLLLIVLDGMSWGVARQLLKNKIFKFYSYYIPTNNDGPIPTIATIPTMTNPSRSALLTGQVDKGGSFVEKKGFSKHKSWQKEAVLFHKKELQKEAFSSALTDHQIQTIAIVLNVIDEQLDGTDQLTIDWANQDIPSLRESLEANNHERMVVLLSDHGHVLDAGSETKRIQFEKKSSYYGQRWRTSETPPQNGEMIFPNHHLSKLYGSDIIMPVIEGIRYGHPHRGYHGGATLQELVVPLIVLQDFNDEIPKGFGKLKNELPWN